MLHTRRRPLATGVTSAGSFGLMVWDRLTAADPGLVRLTLALRGTCSVFLTTVAALIVARVWGLAVPEFASGITLSLMAPFLMREPTRPQRERTLLILLLPAAGATVATTLLHGYGTAGDSAFLVLVFVCFLLHPRSPRVIGIGLVAVVITYIGLYLELPPATLPLQLASLVMAIPITAFACFVVIPMNQAATLRRTVAAVQGRAAHVLRSARDLTDPAATPARAMARLRRDLARLNEAALAADDQLALLEPTGREAVRAGLIDLELATARLVEVVREEHPGPRHATRMRLHERRMRRGRRYLMTPDLLEPGTLRATLVELGRAVHDLGNAARDIAAARQSPPGVTLPPGPLAWRLATRVTLAAALAMGGGMLLSEQRWFWAVMTVYVVFLNARSRGDTIYKGVQRLGGTLFGMVSGLILATVLAGDPGLQSAALLLAVFGMYYWILISYTLGIFCVTVMLGLLYGMLGAPLESLLMLRLEETAIGAAAAIVVAAFVLPTRTRDQVIRSGRTVLAALVEAVAASRLALSGTPDGLPMQAMRRVDRQVADLRLALAPLTAGRLLLRRSAIERPVPALLECVHWTRVLAAASQGLTAESPDASLVAEVTRIERRLAGLAGQATDDEEPSLPPFQAPAGGDNTGRAVQVKAALHRLDRSVGLLAERLEIGTLEGFRLES